MAVSRQVEQSAAEIQDVLSERSPTGLGFVALSGAGGALAAQEVAEIVLGQLGRPRDPSSPSDLGISSLTKMVVALVFGAVAARLGRGLGFLLAAVAGFGALVSAGVDIFDMVQRGGIPGTMVNNQSSNRSRASARARQPRNRARSRNQGGGNQAYSDGGNEPVEEGSSSDSGSSASNARSASPRAMADGGRQGGHWRDLVNQ